MKLIYPKYSTIKHYFNSFFQLSNSQIQTEYSQFYTIQKPTFISTFWIILTIFHLIPIQISLLYKDFHTSSDSKEFGVRIFTSLLSFLVNFICLFCGIFFHFKIILKNYKKSKNFVKNFCCICRGTSHRNGYDVEGGHTDIEQQEREDEEGWALITLQLETSSQWK